MQPFTIQTPSGTFPVKSAGSAADDRFIVDVFGEQVLLEKDDDGYLRASGATFAGHRLDMGLLNMIADYIGKATA
ncbi:hypothetical protein [Chitinophaga sp. Cy-1792]|uniref:hypothetical protein n=1 Tax=Chitinophaga sp. Cy-1792 TaxID=2608339 RepID=UPI00142035BD|nr:hypothetical protein [Chitinophaga sp. Cy-1792]NIG54584.1 hypothetical protein [Chitinophaga sp. Cy-1792]